jgi:hypothetical protein
MKINVQGGVLQQAGEPVERGMKMAGGGAVGGEVGQAIDDQCSQLAALQQIQ